MRIEGRKIAGNAKKCERDVSSGREINSDCSVFIGNVD